MPDQTKQTRHWHNIIDTLKHACAAGRRAADVDDGVLDALASCFDDICSLVDGFVKQGVLTVCSTTATAA
jgi:hypothetical protein